MQTLKATVQVSDRGIVELALPEHSGIKTVMAGEVFTKLWGVERRSIPYTKSEALRIS